MSIMEFTRQQTVLYLSGLVEHILNKTSLLRIDLFDRQRIPFTNSKWHQTFVFYKAMIDIPTTRF